MVGGVQVSIPSVIPYLFRRNLRYFSELVGPNEAPLAAISIQRTLRGSSQARGELLTVIRNNNPTELKLIYLETMPWLLQFYLHTLQVSCNAHLRST